LKEKEEMLRVIGGEDDTTSELLLELHKQKTLTMSFTTMKLCNGHTTQTVAKTVVPNSKLLHELDVNMTDLDGDVELETKSSS
jgi:hypothetical protein